MSCFVHRIKKKEERKLALAQQKKGVKPEAASELLDSEENVKSWYKCTGCGNALFNADKKFDSRTGFPSFWMHIGNHVKENFLETYGRERIQLLCNQCGLHLGHLFPHKKTPTGVRYCINADSIELVEN